MSIKITNFSNASIALAPKGQSYGNFGILGFLQIASEASPILPSERARKYSDAAAVGKDFTTTSGAFHAATAFYAQTPQPSDFTVVMNYDVAQPAALVGGQHDTLPELVQVSSGSFTCEVDGSDVTASAVDFSSATDLPAVAAALDAALTGASCSYNGYQFVIQSSTTGASSTIKAATGDLAEVLGLDVGVAKAHNGLEIETPVDSLVASRNQNKKFIGLDIHKSLRDDQSGSASDGTLGIADWCESHKVLFCNTTNDMSTPSSSFTDIASALKLKGLNYTMTVFCSKKAQYPASSMFGRGASVNFESFDSTVNLNLKQAPSITAEDLTTSELANLQSKSCNAVSLIGDDILGFIDGRMASGQWFDTMHGLLWLENRIEVDMFNWMFKQGGRYTTASINTAKSVLARSLQAAVRNGFIAPGYLEDGTFLAEGFDIQAVSLGDVGSADRAARVYNGLSFRAVGAGWLQKINISGNFVG